MANNTTNNVSKLFYLGITLHTVSGFFLKTSIATVFAGVGLGICCLSFLLQPHFSNPFNRLFKFAFITFLLWEVFILIRPSLYNEAYSAFYGTDRYRYLAYLMPFVIFFHFTTKNLKTLFKYARLNSIIGLFSVAVLYKSIFIDTSGLEIEEYQDYISVLQIPFIFLSCSSFVLLCYPYGKRTDFLLAIVCQVVMLVVAIQGARRGTVFSVLLNFIFLFFILVRNGKVTIFKTLGFLVILSVVTVLLVRGNGSIFFKLFFDRFADDTRSGIEQNMLDSFKGQTTDWIIGRGIAGVYFSPVFINPYRDIIESGYLYLILKGGIIYLSLYVYILFIPSRYAFQKKANFLVKTAGYYLIVHIILLYPFGIPAFDFEYLLVWMSILLCQSKKVRELSNEQLLKFIS